MGFNAIWVPLKNAPPGSAKEALDNLCDVLIVTRSRRCFAAPPYLGVGEDVAVVA